MSFQIENEIVRLNNEIRHKKKIEEKPQYVRKQSRPYDKVPRGTNRL